VLPSLDVADRGGLRAELEEREAAEAFALETIDDLDEYRDSRAKEVSYVHDLVMAFCEGFRARAKIPA
jgi:hypothetical protein